MGKTQRTFLAAAAVAIAGCAPPEHLVLVHGAWMGGWVWDSVAAQLREKGERVAVVDLPAHGQDATPVSGATLEGYVDRVGQAVDQERARVVLVGHSMAGMVISQYAERAPEKVKSLVYLAAELPSDGQSLLDLAAMDPNSWAVQNLVVNVKAGTGDLPAAVLQDVMCADCSAAAAATLQANYRTEPMVPLGTKVSLTGDRWGAVHKSYLFTAEDRAITPALQHQMADAVALDASETLATAHTPQLSDPALLTSALERMIRPDR